MKKGYIYVVLSAILFSSMEVALKMVASDFNPLQMNFLRFFIGSLILLPLAVKGLKNKGTKLNLNDIAFFSATGFICVVVSMVLYQMAIVYSQASVVAVLFSCNPVFVVLFAYMILKEKIYKHTVISMIISFAGILVIMNPVNMKSGFTGIVLTILSAVTFAFYGVVGRTRTDKYGGVALTCFSFLCGSAEMLILLLTTKISAVAGFFNNIGLKSFADVPIFQGISAGTILNLIYIGVFVTGLGYAFYFLAMEATSAATASLVFFIKPALAPIIALIFLHEVITLPMLIGISLILTGSLISFIPGLKMQKNAERQIRRKEKAEEVLCEFEEKRSESAIEP